MKSLLLPTVVWMVRVVLHFHGVLRAQHETIVFFFFCFSHIDLF